MGEQISISMSAEDWDKLEYWLMVRGGEADREASIWRGIAWNANQEEEVFQMATSNAKFFEESKEAINRLLKEIKRLTGEDDGYRYCPKCGARLEERG